MPDKSAEELLRDLDHDYMLMMMYAKNLKWKIEFLRMKLQENKNVQQDGEL